MIDLRYIDADKLKPDLSVFLSVYSESPLKVYSQECIDRAETINIFPVIHGCWKSFGSLPSNKWICSECNGLVEVAHYCTECYYNFCPNCGVKMYGVVENG